MSALHWNVGKRGRPKIVACGVGRWFNRLRVTVGKLRATRDASAVDCKLCRRLIEK